MHLNRIKPNENQIEILQINEQSVQTKYTRKPMISNEMKNVRQFLPFSFPENRARVLDQNVGWHVFVDFSSPHTVNTNLTLAKKKKKPIFFSSSSLLYRRSLTHNRSGPKSLGE